MTAAGRGGVGGAVVVGPGARVGEGGTSGAAVAIGIGMGDA